LFEEWKFKDTLLWERFISNRELLKLSVDSVIVKFQIIYLGEFNCQKE